MDAFGGQNLYSGTLNERAVQGGASIVTQYNRDNLDDFGVTHGSNAEIDDLRREWMAFRWETARFKLKEPLLREIKFKEEKASVKEREKFCCFNIHF